MSSRSWSRRRFLSQTAVLGITAGLAGCSTEPSDDGADDQPSPTTGTKTPTTGTKSDTSTETTSKKDSKSAQTVSFDAPHGATIEGTLYGSGDCGVVLVPQIDRDRESWRPQAELIAEQGKQVLAIDEDPDNRSASVRGAMQYLRSRHDVARLLLVGASSGGEAVVTANANADESVGGTITLSASGGADYASDLQGRLLFVVSKNDDDRFVRVTRQLHEDASEPKEIIEYEGSAHGQEMFKTEHGDELQTKLQGGDRRRLRSVLTRPNVSPGSQKSLITGSYGYKRERASSSSGSESVGQEDNESDDLGVRNE